MTDTTNTNTFTYLLHFFHSVQSSFLKFAFDITVTGEQDSVTIMENVQGKLQLDYSLLTLLTHLPDWASYLYEQHGHNLPDNIRDQLAPLASNPTYFSYARTAYSYFALASSYINPILSTAVSSITTKPDLATVALLLIIIFISLKILNMLVGQVLFWFRMARRVAFWGTLVGLAVWMYARGPYGVAEDVGHWYGVWKGEYAHWSEQDRLARTMREQGIPAGGGRPRW